jgi:hypothetical protein
VAAGNDLSSLRSDPSFSSGARLVTGGLAGGQEAVRAADLSHSVKCPLTTTSMTSSWRRR